MTVGVIGKSCRIIEGEVFRLFVAKNNREGVGMRTITVWAIFACAVCANAGAAVWYVDKDNAGPQDGLSWATAFTTIQAAIGAAEIYSEVWVAEGVYNEPRTSLQETYASGTVETGSLVLKPSVALYGGFAGAELTRLERAAGAYSTIDGSTTRSGQPAYHVVIAADDTVLDGFAVVGGDSQGVNGWQVESGAGLFGYDCAITIADCRFVGNSAGSSGGGLFVSGGGSCTVSDSLFEANSAGSGGGGMSGDYVTLNMEDCILRENSALYGGAMANRSGTLATVARCIFAGNVVELNGGAVNTAEDCDGTFVNCLFAANLAG